MKLTTKQNRKGFTLVELLVVIAIIVALAAMATPAIFKALGRAAMAESVSNGRQCKLIMDSFAMDNDGVYPSQDTADFYEIGGSDTSNDLFKQLFASGNTNSEKIFWVKGSQVCNKARPDDVTTDGGKFNVNRTLEAGDNGWCMVRDQTNVDNPSRPLMFDSPPTGTGLVFDGELWDMKAIVVRIDGSAKPMRLNPSFKLLDGDNKELLTTSSEVWGASTSRVDIAYPLKATSN
jgi:prepilin-type N-terminal cleavage/methylation domain-containing protein